MATSSPSSSYLSCSYSHTLFRDQIRSFHSCLNMKHLLCSSFDTVFHVSSCFLVTLVLICWWDLSRTFECHSWFVSYPLIYQSFSSLGLNDLFLLSVWIYCWDLSEVIQFDQELDSLVGFWISLDYLLKVSFKAMYVYLTIPFFLSNYPFFWYHVISLHYKVCYQMYDLQQEAPQHHSLCHSYNLCKIWNAIFHF